jgi:hypothetical protein
MVRRDTRRIMTCIGAGQYGANISSHVSAGHST